MLPKVEIRKSAAGYYDYAAANLELIAYSVEYFAIYSRPGFLKFSMHHKYEVEENGKKDQFIPKAGRIRSSSDRLIP